MRPTVVTVLAVLHAIAGVLLLFAALGSVAMYATGNVPFAAGILGAALGVYGVANLVCGIGLWTLNPYGRTLEIVISCVGLLGIPIGTIISVLVLIYMFRPGVKVLFSGRPEAAWTVAERQSVLSDAQGGLTVVIIAIVAILGSVVALGIVASIAIPGLLRARMSSNEAQAIGAMRAIVSAQATFASTCANGAYASSLTGLGTPPAGTTIPFLCERFTNEPVRLNGYHLTLSGGDPAEGAAQTCNGTKAAKTFFAVAEPDNPGVTGMRYFATNGDGIYQSREPIPVTFSGVPVGARALGED
jgi:type IV pilus assembly protein PilA